VRGATPYPPFGGTRVPIAAAARTGGPVAGRIHTTSAGSWLVDASGRVQLEAIAPAGATDGDWVSGTLVVEGEVQRLVASVVHAPHLGPSPDPALPERLALLSRRAEIVHAARRLFHDRGFLDVETPARVPCPGLEPHLRAFPAGDELWLITSPELHLKRVLAAGAERVVEFARAFRDDERGPWHRPEFLLVEWYRAFAGLDAIMADCEELVLACARAAGATIPVPFARTTVRGALARSTGLDLAVLQDRTDLARAVTGRGHRVAPDDGWDDLFFRVWIAEVEPGLGRARPEFITDYPASQAALARTRRESWGEVAERFELYIAGIEVANAFHELNDPVEQRRRHEADRAARAKAGAPVYPLDERFLAALLSGMPPASGIAFGLDRLAALLLGADSLDAILPF
jgi:elongation factor P--(R)-beta-lysine ligase